MEGATFTAESLAETLGFCGHERADVRKLAIQGLASHSKDNAMMESHLIANPSAIETLSSKLRFDELPLLGDLFTFFINVSTNTQVAEIAARSGVVHKSLRIIDSIDRSDSVPEATGKVIQDMALMLLNNLTATSMAAVADLVQFDDEDLRGFYLSKLLRLTEGSAKTSARRRWLLNIILNCSRSQQCQSIVLQEDDWTTFYHECLQFEADAASRCTVLQVLRNCFLCGNHVRLIELKFPHDLVALVGKAGQVTETEQVLLVGLLTLLITTEPGMQIVEELNAKKYCQEALPSLAASAQTAMEKDVLPFLDDIQDVFVVNEDN